MSWIEAIGKRLNDRRPLSGKQRERLEEAQGRARRELKRLADFGPPQPDVLQALKVQPAVTNAFKPGDRAALFRRCHPDRSPPEGGPAARDIANIGWATKLARRYLRHIGAETEPIAAWAVHSLRCMIRPQQGSDRPAEPCGRCVSRGTFRQICPKARLRWGALRIPL